LPPWLIISGLGITQIVGWGSIFYSVGALSQDIADGQGWPTSLIFGAFSAALLLSGALSRSFGRIIDRHGARKVMAAGSVVAAVGCTIVGLSQTPAVYVAGWLVIGFAMRMALYDAALVALTQLVGIGARRAFSYLSLIAGFASTIFWPLSHVLSSSYGWQATFLIFAVLNIVICLPIHLTVLAGPPQDGSSEAEPSPDGHIPLTGRDRTIAMSLFAGALAFNGFIFAAMSAHVVPMFESLGFTPAATVTFAAFIGPSQVASRLAEIFLGRRLRAVQLGLIAYGVLPVAFAIFIAGGFGPAAAAVLVVVYGMSNGLVTIAKGAVALAMFGRSGYGRMLGTLVAPNLILNALAPTVFAVVLDYGGPRIGIVVLMGAGVLSALAMLVLARRYPR